MKTEEEYFQDYKQRDLTGEFGSTNEVLGIKEDILTQIMGNRMSKAEARLRLAALKRALAWQNRW